MEYYFGDFNLPRDKFLQEETKSDDGWVSKCSAVFFSVKLTVSMIIADMNVLYLFGAGHHGDDAEV